MKNSLRKNRVESALERAKQVLASNGKRSVFTDQEQFAYKMGMKWGLAAYLSLQFPELGDVDKVANMLMA